MINNDQSYQDFFKEEVYGRFVTFLRNKLGCATVIALIGDDPVFTKRGVHVQLARYFNEFLNENPTIEKTFSMNDGKCFTQRNIAGGTLLFPIDCEDEELMINEGIRSHVFVPVVLDVERASNAVKHSAEPMKNQSLKGNWKEHKFNSPTKLVIHFKRSYAKHIGKTTETVDVTSKEEVFNILYEIYKDKVAFAQCNGQRFLFVKRRNYGSRTNTQLQGSI